MFSLQLPGTRMCDGICRREVMRIGGLGSLGLTLPAMNRHRATDEKLQRPHAGHGKAKSCIILFLMGGPAQHSTFDPKPMAPAEVRGEFGAIQTSVPGIELGELWPRTALQTHRLAILRGVSTGDNAHSSSGYYMLTGQPHAPMNAENVNPGFPNDFPGMGAVVRRLTASKTTLPASIRLPHQIFNTDGSVWPGQDAGFLGRVSEPWLLNCRPADSDFRIEEFQLAADISEHRMHLRRDLLRTISQGTSGHHGSHSYQVYDRLTDNAFDVLGSAAARHAFDLNDEQEVVRERYGRSQFGQSVLMSRRLVEAGVSLVQVNWYRGPDEPVNAPCWDSHTMESQRLKTALCPHADMAISALMEDLADRGLLQETLVVVMSEFGRSPRMNSAGGRDHWGQVFSVVLAGGGVQGGTVYGASDAIGGYPQDGRVSPQDLTATVFSTLGLDPHAVVHDTLERPIQVSRGEVIRAIF